MITDEWIGVGLIGLVALGFTGCVADKWQIDGESTPAVVITKSYTPQSTATGWNYGKDGGYVTTTTPEAWTVVFRDAWGEAHACEEPPQTWEHIQPGDTMLALVGYGRLTHIQYWDCP